MAKCTGVRCPMQYGYKVEECNHTDCPYRTEPMTNADRIRAMSDEELANHHCEFLDAVLGKVGFVLDTEKYKVVVMKWLKQPAEVE